MTQIETGTQLQETGQGQRPARMVGQPDLDSNDARNANARSEMRMAYSQGLSLYEALHGGRSAAFSPSGEGYSDIANYRWQYGKRTGVVQAMRSMKKEMEALDEAESKSTYGVDLPDARTLIRRAATYRN